MASKLLLLRHFLALLQDIISTSATSRMVAVNLVICVASDLLTPTQNHILSLDILGNGSLVQFQAPKWKPMVCSVQITLLVEVLIHH